MISCSENAVEPEPIDPIEGTYLVQGFQVNKSLCWVGCIYESGTVLSSDTLYRSYEISIERMDNREDTLRFRDLEGLDVTVKGISYTGHTSNPDCGYNGRDCAFSKLTGNQLEFDLSTPFGWYFGNGTLYNGILELETTFHYRGTEVDFYFRGYKINNKL